MTTSSSVANSLDQERLSLEGHGAQVNCVAFSADGQTLASASADWSVRTWNTQTGEPKSAIALNNGEVTSVIFSPEGDTLYTSEQGSENKATGDFLLVVDAKSLERVGSYRGHTDNVCVLDLSKDGTVLASASLDLTARLWNTKTGQPIAVLRGHTETPTSIATGVWTVALSPDGSRVATGGSDRTIRLWDAASGREHLVVRGHEGLVFSVAYSPDGTTLVSGSEDRTVRLWDAATGRQQAVLSGHSDWIVSVTFSPDGRTVASAGYDGTVRLWDVASRSAVQTYTHSDKVHYVRFSPDGKTLASGGHDSRVKVWNAAV